METTKITLYEIFGYVLPGSIFLVAVHIILTILNSGRSQLSESPLFFVVNFICAYFLGHFSQFFGNLFSRVCEKKIVNDVRNKILKFREEYKIDKSFSDVEVFKIATNFSHKDKYKTSNIDTYVEREGFYRGSVVSFFFLSLTMGISLFCVDLNFVCTNCAFNVQMPQKIFIGLMASSMVIAFFVRYLRFLTYRINSVLDATRDV